MIGYTTIGTNDIEKAATFYDALLGSMGAKRFLEQDRFVAWTTSPDGCGLSLAIPHDGKPATVGNGVMIALAAESKGQVDALHAKALELGGADEGAPGYRGETFYAGYFRDLDGNKLNAYWMG